MDLSDVCYSGTEEYLKDWIAYAALCDPGEYLRRITKSNEIHSRTALSECAGKVPRMERILTRIGADDFVHAVLAVLLSERWLQDEAETTSDDLKKTRMHGRWQNVSDDFCSLPRRA